MTRTTTTTQDDCTSSLLTMDVAVSRRRDGGRGRGALLWLHCFIPSPPPSASSSTDAVSIFSLPPSSSSAFIRHTYIIQLESLIDSSLSISVLILVFKLVCLFHSFLSTVFSSINIMSDTSPDELEIPEIELIIKVCIKGLLLLLLCLFPLAGMRERDLLILILL